MNNPVRERAYLDGLREPVLITAFNSYQKGGATGPSALAYALEQWDGKLVAELDADGYYINARMRPWIRRDGDRTYIDWPQNVVYRVEAPERSVLVLVGVEPSLNWREFVSAIGDFATRHGVTLAVNLRGAAASVPHTIRLPVKAIYSDPQLQERFGVPELEVQEGPADIGRVLTLHLAANGIPAVDLYALEPFYSAAMPDAEACLSLLQTLGSMFGLKVDTGRLSEAAEAQRRALDSVMEKSEQLRETVHALEQHALGRQGQGNTQLLTAGEAPESNLDPTEVLKDVEALLRSAGTDSDDASR